MKQITYLILCLLWGNVLLGQTEEDQIRTTLNHYIEGTSYNQTERIRKAFYAEAELFLDNRDGGLFVVPVAEYIGLFEKGEKGKFNGRMGRILSVDHFGNIAMGKVEILVPRINKRYIDMFILKKIEGDWKIISKTANAKDSDSKGERILFVLSNASQYGTSDIPTGNSFKEIVDVFHSYREAGFIVDFVSPKGGPIPLAYINMSELLQKSYVYDPDLMYALSHTHTPDQIDAGQYRAVYFVGGSGAMYGVPENEAIQQIAMEIYEEHGGIVSSICHGTAGIVNLKTKDGKYLVDGKRVSGYPESYERQDREYFKHFPFLIQQTIEVHGGKFQVGPKNTAHVEADGRLITGQNHLSCAGVAEKVIEALTQE